MASAEEGLGGSGDAMYTDDTQRSLEEFIHKHPLPQSVSVTGGSLISRDATITRGDVLLLRNKTPTSITLSFVDKVTGDRQELAVKPDIPVQFLALPPKDGSPAGQNGGRAGNSRPVSMITYPTVSDLLMDCPTFFEANSTYDDPYLPGFSVKPGDRFYYVKVVRDVAGDKRQRLQCRTESGELVCLSTSCKGNFTVLKDDTTYTLQQLTDLAKVPRRLKVDRDSLAAQEEENTESNNNIDSEMLEKLVNCSDVINMTRPQEMLEVSPWDNLETVWRVPVDSSLLVRLFSSTDYEEPMVARRIKPEPISAFAHEHENEFPVQAAILSYIKPLDIITQNLHSSREIIVHEQLRRQKLFVKDSKKDDYFAIDKSVDISFVQIPQTLSSVFQMMTLRLGSQVRVLADVAADFPEPFILRYGDVLCVTKHESSSWKLKHSATGDVPIAKCERLVQGKKAEKLKLPLDLEVNLVLLEDPSQLKVTKLSDILSGVDEIPVCEVSVMEGKGGSYKPLPASLQVLDVLTDSELLVSPLSSVTAISPLIKKCVRIPLRHKLVLGLKRKLEFPEGYFVLPSKYDTVCLGIERVQEGEYEELVQARKMATDYEDVVIGPCREAEDDARSQASSTGRGRYAVHQEALPSSSSSGTLERRRRKDRMHRFSQALNPKNWHWGRGGKPPESAEEEEENPPPPPPPPVSGILTLSLQPSQSVSNEYTQGLAPESGNAHHASQDAGCAIAPDDTYEDVEVSRPPDRLRPPADDAEHTSHPAAGGSCSDLTQSGRERPADMAGSKTRAANRRRRRSDPGLKMLVHGERSASSSGLRRKAPERCRGELPSEVELERAPAVHHRRTRSPDVRDQLTHSARKERRKPSPGQSQKNDASSEEYGMIWERGKKDEIRSSESGNEITKEKDASVLQTVSADSPSASRRKHKTQSPVSYTEKQSTEERPDSERSRKTDSEKSSKPRLPPDSEKFRKSRPPDAEKTKKSGSPDKSKTRKPRSPDADKTQIPGSPDVSKTRKYKISDADETKKPRASDEGKTRKPRSPDMDQPRKPKSVQFAVQTGLTQSLPAQQSRALRHTSPNSGDTVQSRENRPERREEERRKREKKFPPVDRLQNQPETDARKVPSPRADRRFKSEQLSSEGVPSPVAERTERTPQPGKNKHEGPESPFNEKRTLLPQTSSGKTQSSGAEDSPQRPRRPRRKTDADRLMDRSMDSVDSGDWSSSAVVAGKQDKAARTKPAVPPKPVLSPSPRTVEAPAITSKPSRNPPPVAPRRKRAERIGSTEAEMFDARGED
ncbi:hypothetical protein ACOMHN_056305 [Nucella lapillus]